MLRAVAMAARLGFTIDRADRRGDRPQPRGDRAQRAGATDRGVLQAASIGRVGTGVPDDGRAPAARADRSRAAERRRGERLWQSLAALDAYRRRLRRHPRHADQRHPAGLAARAARHVARHPRQPAGTELEKEPRLSLGMLPLARRDVERLRQILGLQRRLLDTKLSPRAQARPDASRSVSRSADVAGDSRPGAGGRRALARVHRSGRRRRRASRTAQRRRFRAPRDAGAGVDRPIVQTGDELAVRALELAHELHERRHALFRKRVVDRRAHAADRSMPFEAVEPSCGGLPCRTSFPVPRSAGGTSRSSANGSRSARCLDRSRSDRFRRTASPPCARSIAAIAGKSAERLQPLHRRDRGCTRRTYSACCRASCSPPAPCSSASSGRLSSERSSRSSRMMTSVTPDGPRFFCAPA